jgi:hypothetical protein
MADDGAVVLYCFQDLLVILFLLVPDLYHPLQHQQPLLLILVQ